MASIDQLGIAPARIVAGAGNIGVFGGAGSAVVGWMAGQDLVAWGGLLIGCVGLWINWHHKRALRQLERERLAIERERMMREVVPVCPD